MDRKELFKKLAGLIFLIFILNFLANKFHWYVSLRWSDMPMHFLGGLWLGLASFLLISKDSLNFRVDTALILKIMVCVFSGAILWELFEFYFVNRVAEYPFNLVDTISDLIFGLLGGLCAIVYIWKKQQARQLE